MSGRRDLTVLAPGGVATLRQDAEQTVAAPDRPVDNAASGALLICCRAGADLVPPLVSVGRPDRARQIIEDLLVLLDEQLPGVAGSFLRGRLLGLRAWIADASGDHTSPDSDLQLAPVLERSVPRVHSAPLATSLPPLRFQLLGRFGVCRGSWRAGESDWGRPVDARLVRLLLVYFDQPLSEDQIFEALWPELSVSSARRSLHVAVSRARGVLDPAGSERSAIESVDRCYRLVLGGRDLVDAEVFRSAAEAALSEDGEGRHSRLEHARSLWGGEPLVEERYSDWATAYRERLIDRYIAVLTALVDVHERGGNHPSAVDVARELVDLDPLNEGGHRALMTAHTRTGRRGHALRQYLECRRALIEQLGVEPAEETSRLQAQILAGEAV